MAPCSFPPGKETFRQFGNQEIEKLASFYGEEKKNGVGEDLDSIIGKYETKKEYQSFKLQAPKEWKDWSLKDT